VASADGFDIYALGDAMDARGWHLDRQQMPPALHAMITPAHAPHVAEFLTDLRAATEEVRHGPPAQAGAAAMYGMVGALPDRGQANDLIVQFLDSLDRSPT